MTKLIVTETAENISRYAANGLQLYATPGAQGPYWASSPSFMYDEVVATPYNFDFGWDTDFNILSENDIEAVGSYTASIEVEMLAPRND